MTPSNQSNNFKPLWITAGATILASLITSLIGGSFLIIATKMKIGGESESQSSISPRLIEQCSQTIEDLKIAKDIVNACNKAIQKSENDPVADYYINRARARVVLWESEEFSKNLDFKKLVGEDFQQALSINSNSPRVLWNNGYWRDFQERVLQPNPNRLCRSAKALYGEAIDKYITKYESIYKAYKENGRQGSIVSSEKLSEDEAYALVESGHWINNRDKDWDLAIHLYDIVLAHYEDTNNPIEYNALVSRGVAWYDDGFYKLAIKDFEKAIEVKNKIAKSYEDKDDFKKAREINNSSELYNNLGSAYAKDNRYSEAAQAYSKAVENQTDNTKQYYSLRDWGYALILQGALEYLPYSLNSQAQANFQNAINVLEKAEKIVSRPNDELLYVAFGIAYNFSGDKNMATNKFSLVQKINPMNKATEKYTRISSNPKQIIDQNHILTRQKFFTNPIPHDIGHDPVLEVKHKNSYCKATDPRIE